MKEQEYPFQETYYFCSSCEVAVDDYVAEKQDEEIDSDLFQENYRCPLCFNEMENCRESLSALNSLLLLYDEIQVLGVEPL